MNLIEPIKFSKDLCYFCLEHKDNIEVFEILDRKEGSLFKNCFYRIQLCDECKKKFESLREACDDRGVMLNNKTMYYPLEEELVDYMSQLPLVSKELLMNSVCISDEVKFEPQDWLDIQMGLKDRAEVIVDYGMEKLVDITTKIHIDYLELDRDGIPSDTLNLENHDGKFIEEGESLRTTLAFNPLRIDDLNRNNFLLLTLENKDVTNTSFMSLDYDNAVALRDYLNNAISFIEDSGKLE